MGWAIYMADDSVCFGVKVEREARNETFSRSEVRSIHMCGSFLKMGGPLGELREEGLTRSDLPPTQMTKICAQYKGSHRGQLHQCITSRRVDQILPDVYRVNNARDEFWIWYSLSQETPKSLSTDLPQASGCGWYR